MNLGQLEDNIKPFATDFNKQMQLLFKKKENIILGINRSQLMTEGINIEGQSLPSYKPVTVTIRQSKGLQVNHMDLNFSGAFQKAMFINWDNEGFTIESQDYKEDSLNNRYGQVLGLTDENLTNLIKNQILPELINKIYGI